jgi:hypothetical protein
VPEQLSTERAVRLANALEPEEQAAELILQANYAFDSV